MSKGKRLLRSAFCLSLRDALITVLCILLSCGLAALLTPFGDTDTYVPLIFVLAVLVVSRLTDGYLPGLLASAASVLAVNYAFTYPYFDLNFSLTGYPLTFLCFFCVSIFTCTLTSRMRAAEKARREGEREKLRANLLRAISHDLRTPLTSIVGTLNTVSENEALFSPEERRLLLTDAKRDAEWLINMVENLLSITRMEGSAAPDLHKEVHAVEEVVGEAVARFRKQYSSPEVTIHCPQELIFAPMDAMLVEQVIMNLLVNTALHSGASAATVSIGSRDGCALIRVEDNGSGIPSEKLPHLFDGLGRGQPDAKRGDAMRTMGIGLSVCRSIAVAHGGTITAKNIPGGGARFTFTLPMEENAHEAEAEDPDC